ncbi:MAG TPA: nucleoside deaminase [Tenericutes bacterium]|jgi:tRNA(adenine34) deaminase|nr:nucleoside deaminase [Mycoplasmatota bacterium]
MDEKYMKEAYKEAVKAYKKDEVPIGAVIVYNDKIIARAHNLKEKKQQSICHAEILAIQKASKKLKSWRLNNCKLYVTLEPCPMCAGAIIQARIEEVVYAVKDEKSGYCGSLHNTLEDKRLNHKVKIKTGIMNKECQELLKNFFKAKRRKSN